MEWRDDSSSSSYLRKVNDAVNAINNTVKRCVRGPEGTLYVLNQEGGTTREDLNKTGEALYGFLRDEVFERDNTLPPIMSDRFRDDTNLDLFEVENPLWRKRRRRDPRVTLARSIVPGLGSLRATITQLMIKAGVSNLSDATMHSFFTKRTCNDPKCLRGLYGDNLPALPVRHPAWFYYPEDEENYSLEKAVIYIREFERKPVSTECALCARYHELACDTYASDDMSTTLTLAGTPDEFALNETIMSMYSMHTLEDSNFFDYNKLEFHEHKPGVFVVRYGGVLYD